MLITPYSNLLVLDLFVCLNKTSDKKYKYYFETIFCKTKYTLTTILDERIIKTK